MNVMTPHHMGTAYRSAAPVEHPIALILGSIYNAGQRRIRLDRIHDNGLVELTDLDTLGNLMVRINGEEGLKPPTLDWMLQAYKDGLLFPVEDPTTSTEAPDRNVLIDSAACIAADRKSAWRHNLACRALDAGILRTDSACQEWLNADTGRSLRIFSSPSPARARSAAG